VEDRVFPFKAEAHNLPYANNFFDAAISIDAYCSKRYEDYSKDTKNGTFWPNQSHLFTHPFYYIEYDVAQMSVFEFYESSKHNFQASWNDYNRLCHNGGSKGYLELLKESNLSNPFLDDNVTKICKPILEEFYSL